MKDEAIKTLIKSDSEREMLKNFKRSREFKKDLIDEMVEDFEFAVGDQWDQKDVEKLRSVGVHALTINKIQPNLFLLSGIQRQNRTDFRAFPEGKEDSLLAEIATLLLKNSMKRSMAEFKVSEIFEDGIICGEGDLQPYIDYTNDLVNGELKIKKVSPFKVYVDPDSIEYDLSDAEYVFKLTTDLSEDQIIKLYPDKESEIKEIGNGKLNLEKLEATGTPQTDDYREDANYDGDDDWYTEKTFDLLEMEYKKYVAKYIVVDKNIGSYKQVDTKQEADAYADQANAQTPDSVRVIKRMIPEIWIRVMVGTTEIDDYQSPFYPKWKTFTIIQFLAHRITTPIDKKSHMVQGIVRSMKDLQREHNKRRTQTLRHINSVANSGWMGEEKVFKNKKDWEKYGSSPGILLEYKAGMLPPQRIVPHPLPQGIEYLAKEAAEDMKATSGINSDLLAMEDKTASGRAIYLRQQQGVVMVQRMLDNFQHTKKLLGKFILSQLGELYSVETAARVLGQNFIKKNFSVPIHEIAEKISAKVAEGKEPTPEEANIIMQVQNAETLPVMDDRGEMVMTVDNDAVGAVVNQVLNDQDIMTYDISVGESQSTETIKVANYTMLMDLIKEGIPIPPDILIEESMLSNESKTQIKQAIERMQQAPPQGAA